MNAEDRFTATRDYLMKLPADLDAMGSGKQTPREFRKICELVAFAKGNLTRLSHTYPQQH